MSFVPKELETHIDWRASDVADPRQWTMELTDADSRELHHALQVAKSVSDNLLEIRKESFPLDRLVNMQLAQQIGAESRLDAHLLQQ